jgi:putative ATP-binding cassette transporter
MRLFGLFFRYSPRLLFLAIVAGALAGGLSAALMALIHVRLNQGGALSAWSSLASFAGLVALVLLTGYAARASMLRLATRLAQDLRLSLCRQILALPLRRLEEMGSNRVLAALTEDTASLGVALLKLPELCVSIAVLAGCLVYLAYLSPFLVIAFLLFVAMGILTTRLPEARARQILSRAREDADEMVRLFEAMNQGIKPLKLHAQRRRAFIEELSVTVRSLRRRTFDGQHIYALTQSWGQVLYFVFIGIILYGFSAFESLELPVLIGYTLTVLYMRPPIIALLDMMPDLARASVSLQKIERLGLSLGLLTGTRVEAVSAARCDALTRVPPLRHSIELAGIRHSYYRERDESYFVLGPIDLTIHAGELLFLVGGNGSGKTTLAKLITGLYAPEEGEIRVDGARVSGEDGWEAYRQNFAAVFSDFYVFEALLGLDLLADDLDAEARRLLTHLQLDHKVSVERGVLSTTRLSQGQRKRLALLTAYLEDRPLYVFDEWAADQDPLFKRVFYTELLPELKRAGKTVIVISHDDRYYDIADRIVKLEDGRISSSGLPWEESYVPAQARERQRGLSAV